MKKRFSFFLFSLLLAHLNAQESHTPDNLFPVRSAAFYNGFATIVSGQKLDYPPVLQKGKLALQVVSRWRAHGV
jgi:hypothetical protein